jgi:hypothetical protein
MALRQAREIRMTPRGRSFSVAAVALSTVLGSGACASKGQAEERGRYESRTGIDDAGGISLFGGGGKKNSAGAIGVNSFLWRASLDTLNFMPLASEDPFGGVIITDWYANPSTPTERFKLTVYILDTRLRADGIKVSVFKQVQGAAGWADAATDPDTAIQIENQILVRARQLRLSTVK